MISEISGDELQIFKGQVKEWLQIDAQIKEYQAKISFISRVLTFF